MQTPPFAVTYDYRCPFARNAHEHILSALRSGAEWEVEMVPFSLSQCHVDEGQPAVWDDPGRSGDILALEASIAVRDLFPARFLDVHASFFAARHDEGKDVRNESVIREVLESNGVEADSVFAAIKEGWPREVLRKSHESAVADHAVFGVPTFIAADRAVFVRILTRPGQGPDSSADVIERVLRLMTDHEELNEFKHTELPR